MKYRVQNEVAAQMNSWRARRHMFMKYPTAVEYYFTRCNMTF